MDTLHQDICSLSQSWSVSDPSRALRCLQMLPNMSVIDEGGTILLRFTESVPGGHGSITPAVTGLGCLAAGRLEVAASTQTSATRLFASIEAVCAGLLERTARSVAAAPPTFTRITSSTLEHRLGASSELTDAFLVSHEGWLLAGTVPVDVDAGGVVRALLRAGQHAAVGLQRGELEQLIVHGEWGYGIVAALTPDVILVARAPFEARLGAVMSAVGLLIDDLLDDLEEQAS